MTVLDKLKSLLGLESSRSSTESQRDVGVTVEHEPETEATETEEAVEEPETEPEPEPEPEAAGTDESVDVLNGIGPSYAERLNEAGIETVADLAAADAAELAEQTDIGESRLEGWIEQARSR